MHLLYFIFIYLDLSDRNFIKRYRLSKNLAKRVITLLTPFMNVPSTSRGLSIERKVRISKLIQIYNSILYNLYFILYCLSGTMMNILILQ